MQKTKSGLYTRAGRVDRAVEAGDIRGITLILRDWFSGFADDTKGRQRLIGCPLGLLILLSPPPPPPTLTCSSPYLSLILSCPLYNSLSLYHAPHRVPNKNIFMFIYVYSPQLSPPTRSVRPSVRPYLSCCSVARATSGRPSTVAVKFPKVRRGTLSFT